VGGKERERLTHGIYITQYIHNTHIADIIILDMYSILDKLLTKVMSQTINQVTAMHK